MSGRPLFSLESLAEIAEDPEQTAYFRIDSPRSVDAMRRLGVADGDLWYLPPEALTPSVLEARQKKLTPKQRKEFAQMRFEKRERTRTDLLTKLLKERTQVMKDQQEAQEKMRETAIRKGMSPYVPLDKLTDSVQQFEAEKRLQEEEDAQAHANNREGRTFGRYLKWKWGQETHHKSKKRQFAEKWVAMDQVACAHLDYLRNWAVAAEAKKGQREEVKRKAQRRALDRLHVSLKSYEEKERRSREVERRKWRALSATASYGGRPVPVDVEGARFIAWKKKQESDHVAECRRYLSTKLAGAKHREKERRMEEAEKRAERRKKREKCLAKAFQTQKGFYKEMEKLSNKYSKTMEERAAVAGFRRQMTLHSKVDTEEREKHRELARRVEENKKVLEVQSQIWTERLLASQKEKAARRPASAVSVRDIERRRLFVEDRLHKKQHLDRKLRTEQEELAAEVAEKADKAAERRRHIEHVRGIAKEVATDSLRRRQTALNLLEYKWPTENEKRLTQMSARLPKSSLRIDVDRMSDYQRDFKDREEEWLKTHSPLDTERLLLSKLQEQKQKMNESRKLQTAQATQRGARTRGDSRGAQTTRGGTRALPDSANPLGVSQQAPTAAKTSLPTAPPEKAKSMKADPNANRASQSPRPSRRTVPRIPLLSLQDHESLRTALTLTPSTRLPTPGVVYANNYYEALAPTPHKNVRALPLPADDITLLAQSPDPPPASPRAGRRTYGAYRLANTEAVHGRDGDRERRSTSSRRLREKETNGQPSPPTADLGASAKETTLQLRPTRAKGGEKERETQSKENVDSPRAKEGGSKKGDKDPSRVLKTSGSMRARKYAPEKGGGGTGAQAQPQSVPVA